MCLLGGELNTIVVLYAMDAPDTTFDRDRGLPDTHPSPPMRVDRHSGPYRDPAMGGSLVSLVDLSNDRILEVSPASPGMDRGGDTAAVYDDQPSNERPVFPHHIQTTVSVYLVLQA